MKNGIKKIKFQFVVIHCNIKFPFYYLKQYKTDSFGSKGKMLAVSPDLTYILCTQLFRFFDGILSGFIAFT